MHWTLQFKSGIKVASPTLARIAAAIENLQSEGHRNYWVILEATREDGSLARFLQTACVEPGSHWGQLRNIRHDDRDKKPAA